LNITFDRYHKYEEIRAFLQDCVREYPDLTRIECIGKSFLDREILMLEITNRNTGPGADKPGVYSDGNTHAGEVTGCEVILYTVKRMLEAYGKDPIITEMVDTRVFYFIPRITVDGSEHYLATPHMIRSSMRPWPPETDEVPGLYPEDVNCDGRILQMRVRNPDGNWKASPRDPRLMVRRRPDESGGTYYDLLPEGLIKDYDPDVPVAIAPGKYRLDFNRQYPANWTPPARQRGSGDYPFAEPEIKAVGDFYLAHPNIATTMAYHTSGGILLRPFADRGVRDFDDRDLELYRALGEIGQAQTGYPLKSVYEMFTYDPGRPEVGSDLEWVYESLGILAFETELWDMQARAGIPVRGASQMKALTDKDREEDGLKLLKWQDEQLGGSLFVNWHEFNHPQLGEVEIGGWEPKQGRQNPPASLLEEECKKNFEFTVTRAVVSPRLVIEKINVENLADGVYKIEAVVKNESYLPTHVTFNALKMKQAKPVRVKLSGISEGHIIAGGAEQEIGHLGGRAGGGDIKKKLTWAVRAPMGAKVTVEAATPRAGKVKKDITLE